VTSFRPYLIWFAIAVVLTLGAIRAMEWLRAHPEHDPMAPLELAHPQGWATGAKLRALVGDNEACFGAFDRAGIDYERRAPIGKSTCRANQRMILADAALLPRLAPASAAPGCAVTAAMTLWNRDTVQPLAQQYFGQKVIGIENLGSYNCRTIRGGSRMSEHSTANAIDISAFILADGTRISLINDWTENDVRREFLRAVRDGACGPFSTVLSPDHDRAHADHFHLDMALRPAGWSTCR
jgi:hypothetical protein